MNNSLIDNPARFPLVVGGIAGLTAVLGGIVLAYGGPLAGLAILLAGFVAVIVLRNIEVGFAGVIGVVLSQSVAVL